MSSVSRISVIIPCYNHGKYLARAIRSVREQEYDDVEIIIVDDGSTDTTKEDAARFADAKYIYQQNQGLSAARNTGIRASTGKYLVFLDADDWLAENAFSINLEYLLRSPEAAFVSGGHFKISDAGKILEEVRTPVREQHYLNLLQGNYIGMHATVMYQRWVFDHFLYDTSLRACEDYDLYLKIARKFPVIHHTKIIAWYLIHGNNMSANKPMMLESVLHVLNRQRPFLNTEEEKRALEAGNAIWTAYYTTKKSKRNMRKTIKKYTPDVFLRVLNEMGIIKRYIPKVGCINSGDFKRVTPFSTEFGYDRGGPVDRYYIENFLEKNKNAVHGRVLEIGDNDYTLKYGGNKLTSSDILHIDKNNPKATIIGDLSNAPQIADNTYDCIILTQTLHLIYDFKGAISTCYRILKPGGTFLMTVPGITHIDQGEWKSNWLWAFTGASVTRILEERFPSKEMEVNTFGNVYTAAAFLYGMGVNEVSNKSKDHNDPHYQVIITAKVVKPL